MQALTFSIQERSTRRFLSGFLSSLAYILIFLCKFAEMNVCRRLIRWCEGVGHGHGFGIQSPFAFDFVTTVINQKWPYYSYEPLKVQFPLCSKEKVELGRLLFRLANFIQPKTVYFDKKLPTPYLSYIQAGCRRVITVNSDISADLFCVSISDDVNKLVGLVGPLSVGIVFDIYKNKKNEQQWNNLLSSDKVRVSFDLYHLGVVFFDSTFLKHHYLLNF